MCNLLGKSKEIAAFLLFSRFFYDFISRPPFPLFFYIFSKCAVRRSPAGVLFVGEAGGQVPQLLDQAANAACLSRIDFTVVCVHVALPFLVRWPASVRMAAI